MDTLRMIEQVKARRVSLTWRLPDGRTFTAYPKDEQSKTLWLEQAKARGWKLV